MIPTLGKHARRSNARPFGSCSIVAVWLLLVVNVVLLWELRSEPMTTPLLMRDTAVALPSVRTSTSEEASINRDLYGGKGDKKHLGGFVAVDMFGISPAVWKWMVEYAGVKSVLDVGCGRGFSSAWFDIHGIKVQCVEGSHDAVEQSVFSKKSSRPHPVVEHDFTRGPWWPSETVDAVWCVEFLEHVGRNYLANYMAAFRKAALVFVTSSNWGGWHHVEVHDNDWWISKFQMHGFVYSESMTNKVRQLATNENEAKTQAANGQFYNAQHVWLNMKVFINPAVASLPQHAHLLAEHGCFLERRQGRMIHRECNTQVGAGKESSLPSSFYPLGLTPEMDRRWDRLLQAESPPAVDQSERIAALRTRLENRNVQ